ncbi:MAG TPA: NAD(P)-dependent oxidoreductase [Steroidobacteraceae bacterium]|jgi:3-hydroxyisobutyrate dehydrogenase-like beta-hydroxyacid dehydrogenase|nr:NAD(P)-dependent oxidoreductase [Steroidobacteraceae bacterium]
MKIGFIGLGQMGTGMAANLLKAGHEVHVYNRTAAKMAPLVRLGARAHASVKEVCSGEAVFTMLADDRALESVVFGNAGVLASLQKGAVHISSSTVGVDLSERLAAAHAQAAQRYLAAPVFGRPEAAASGKLFIVAGGAADVVETCMPLLNALGQKTFVMSAKPQAANLVKLSGNFLIAAVIESLGEAIALVSKGGVDKQSYVDLLTSTLFDAPIYKIYGRLIVEQQFEPAGFAAPLGQKDIRLALAAADTLKVPLPLANLLRDRFLTLLATGGESLDWSAISTLAARDSGQLGRPGGA